MTRPFRHVLTLAAAISSAALISLSLSAQTMGTPEKFTASAMDINTGRAGNIDITIDRWSTDAQRDKLMAVVMDKGPEKLLDALQDLPRMGYFSAPGNLGWDIHFSRRAPLPDGGERVTLITDRRIGFWEASRMPRSFDYPFTVIEMRLNADGVGEGKMSIATKVIYDKKDNMITLENYQTSPVMLTNVKRLRAAH